MFCAKKQELVQCPPPVLCNVVREMPQKVEQTVLNFKKQTKQKLPGPH